MIILRLSLIALLCVGQWGEGCQAQSALERARSLIFDKDFVPTRFPSKPARELMSKGEFQTYSRALTEFQCDRAEKVLSKAFVRQYPFFKGAGPGPPCPRGSHCHIWQVYSSTRFQEYGYCVTIVGLKEAEDEIRRRKIPQVKFKMRASWSKETHYDNQWIKGRDHKLTVLIGAARVGYRPALLKLAELVRRGDVFEAGDEVEYYILAWACVAGEDCSEQAARIAELRALIGAQHAGELDKKARVERVERRDLHKILLGEPI